MSKQSRVSQSEWRDENAKATIENQKHKDAVLTLLLGLHRKLGTWDRVSEALCVSTSHVHNIVFNKRPYSIQLAKRVLATHRHYKSI